MSKKQKINWFYEGPVYRFGKKFINYTYMQTKAVSEAQAINNFLFKAAEAIGYDRAKGAEVDIDREQVWSENEKDGIDWPNIEPIKTCEKCGKQLNDAGQCPICDLGDEDA